MIVLLLVLQTRQATLAHFDPLAISPLEVIERFRCRVGRISVGTRHPGIAVIGAGPRPRIVGGGGMRRNLAILLVAVGAHALAGK